VMDGLEAAEKIFELDSDIPIVAMTANIMTNDLEIYKKSGMHDCVGKPFTSQELWRCLLKYFKPVNWQEVNETLQKKADNQLKQKLLNTFVRDNRNKFSEIEKAINCGDIKLAHRLVHTLKGNAGQLGNTLLQKAATDIERQLKEGISSGKALVRTELLAELKLELNTALAEFALLVTESGESETAEESGAEDQNGAFGGESAQELFEKLEGMLERGNPECRKLIGSLRRIPESGEMIRQMEELIRQMEDFDFEPALESLAKIKKQYSE